jgi:hypothetical protein
VLGEMKGYWFEEPKILAVMESRPLLALIENKLIASVRLKRYGVGLRP